MQLENAFAEDHVHTDIRLEYSMAEFLHKALRHEEKRLGRRMHPIEDHPELSWLATDSPQLEVYRHTYKWTGKFRQYFDGLLQTIGNQNEIPLGDMKHGLLRKLKSIGLAYIGFLREELQQYGDEPYQAPPIYKDIEDRIVALEESFSQPPFDTVRPVELLP